MAKHERRDLMFFVSLDAGSTWEVLGVDNDDLSKELNPDVTRGKNVIGESTFRHLGYEPEVSVDPYYAEVGTNLYTKLMAAAIQEKYDDDSIKGLFVEVCYDTATTTTMSGTGYQREAYIVPQSTGGDTAGLGIPFTVNPVGPPTLVDVEYTIASRSADIQTHTPTPAGTGD